MNEVQLRKIEIAKDFVDFHRYGIDAWTPRFQNPTMDLNQAYLKIYEKLMNDDYGEIRETKWGEDDNPTEFEIEISRYDSHHGASFLFTWEPVTQYSWEVSYDDDNFPIYGLDVFQSVAEAQHAAQAYIEGGKENVRLTFFEDDCAIETISY